MRSEAACRARTSEVPSSTIARPASPRRATSRRATSPPRTSKATRPGRSSRSYTSRRRSPPLRCQSRPMCSSTVAEGSGRGRRVRQLALRRSRGPGSARSPRHLEVLHLRGRGAPGHGTFHEIRAHAQDPLHVPPRDHEPQAVADTRPGRVREHRVQVPQRSGVAIAAGQRGRREIERREVRVQQGRPRGGAHEAAEPARELQAAALRRKHQLLAVRGLELRQPVAPARPLRQDRERLPAALPG